MDTRGPNVDRKGTKGTKWGQNGPLVFLDPPFPQKVNIEMTNESFFSGY